MSITNKHYVDRFFEKDKENESYFICKYPGCTVKRKRPAGTGFGNIIQHLQSAHPTYISDYQANNSAFVYQYNGKVVSIFKWIEWIVMDNLPFTSVESERFRKNSTMKSISRPTLMKYMNLLTRKLEDHLKGTLPNKFGLIFDSWSINATNYTAIFACYCPNGQNSYPLLAFSPLLDETSHSAGIYCDFITFVMELYGRNWNDILFVICVNCNTKSHCGQTYSTYDWMCLSSI